MEHSDDKPSRAKIESDSQSSYSEGVGSTISIALPSATTTGYTTPDNCNFKKDIKNGKTHQDHRFQWSSLWRPAEVNPATGKSFTFPLLRFWDPYSTAFWLATLGFFVAFFSWFAFAPLMPEAVKKDLKLSNDQITNSNLASLGGTAIVRLVTGPACDRFGPRKVLVTLLVLGAIPSGLAALVKNIQGLETIRFFISILGGTFVPTQAYTTAFFDKTIVGTANAFSGGWGNLGGGVTVVSMIGVYERFAAAGYSPHLSWRLCFLVVPVPCLLVVAAVILLLGKDHPAGKWSNRHESDAALTEKNEASVSTAQPEQQTVATLLSVFADLRVWMCAVCYCLTFGLETAMDAALPGLINTLFASDTFTSIDAAYVASTYGLLNLFARPLGGIISDILYARFGLRAKVYWLLGTACLQGVSMIGLGLYINHSQASIGGVVGFIILIAFVGFAANGACYSVYCHLRPASNGAVAGIVGASGNVGGIFYTLIFKYQAGKRIGPSPSLPGGSNSLGTKFWISGIVNAVAILPLFFVSLGDAV